VFTCGTMLAGPRNGCHSAAVRTFSSAMTVDMFTGGCLKTAVAVRRGTAIHTVFFIGIMLVQTVKTLGTTGTKFF